MAYLMHHGILGQKWGVRNGPPYPLSNKAKSSAEKTVSKRKTKELLESINNRDTLGVYQSLNKIISKEDIFELKEIHRKRDEMFRNAELNSFRSKVDNEAHNLAYKRFKEATKGKIPDEHDEEGIYYDLLDKAVDEVWNKYPKQKAYEDEVNSLATGYLNKSKQLADKILSDNPYVSDLNMSENEIKYLKSQIDSYIRNAEEFGWLGQKF